MVFSSLIFLFCFLPLFLICYFIPKKRKFRNIVLLLFSLAFYGYGEPIYLILMILSIVINYFIALWMNKSKHKKNWLIIDIVFNIGLLLIFKYSNFFIDNINNIFNFNIKFLEISLPIGISFYTFQILTYVIDVYKGEVNVQESLINLGCYVSSFPQLIAGPIVRYSTVNDELNNRHETIKDFSSGIRRFSLGLAKKAIIANEMAYVADTLYASCIKDLGFIGVLVAAIAFTFQIYFDFSGYSDMAIGLGKMFGFHFLENFDYPYISCSITEFWRRWHISLSTWFRDYIYIPLGGNRVSKPRWIFNIFVVWMLTGLWHGASWNFVIWGLYFGIILLIEKLFLSKFLDKLPKIVRWIYSFALINLGWIIFRMEDISSMKYLLLNIFNNLTKPIGGVLAKNYFLLNYIPYFIIGIILMFPIIPFIKNKFKDNKYFVIIDDVVLLIVFVISICLLINNTYNPFIYFRF